MSSLRDAALERIRSNIAKHGHHVYVVAGGGPLPRFAYTIGVSEKWGIELLFAGASFFTTDEATSILNEIARSPDIRSSERFEINGLGSFSLRAADSTWTAPLLLGLHDFYGRHGIQALQVVPDQVHWTIDVPDLGQPWSSDREPIWRWLHDTWKSLAPAESVAVTNIAALQGEAITEAARWEEREWELFAGSGPDVLPSQARTVPLATLLAVDDTLSEVAELAVGQALWRDSRSAEWHVWERRTL